jgi:hypothetical protein
MFQELAMNFKLFQSGAETFKLRFFVGHDGSMVRLASGLGFGEIAPLRWPALGSEIVMEVRVVTLFACFESCREFAHWAVYCNRSGKHLNEKTLFV